MPEIHRGLLFRSCPLAYVVASLQAGSFPGGRRNRDASAEQFRDGVRVADERAGTERSQRIVVRSRYQLNNYLLGTYSNARAVL